MFKKFVVLAGLVSVLSPVVATAQQSEEEATLIVYRADDSIRSNRISMDVHAGAADLGRLRTDKSVVMTLPAGSYTVGSNIKGTEGTVVDLKPGQVHYVMADVEVRSNRVSVTMAEVDEQVAGLL
jgi:hypothetical protein